MSKSLSLPKLEREQLELDNLICSRDNLFTLQLPEHSARIQLTQQKIIAPCLSISFYAEGRRGYLYLDFHAVATILGEEKDPSVYPETLLFALLASQLNGPLQNLSSVLQTELEIDEITPCKGCGEEGIHFGIVIKAGSTSGFGLLFPPDRIVENITGLIADQPAKLSPLSNQLTLPVQLVLAERTLLVDDLKCLEAGDVLMLPPTASANMVILKIPGYGACRAQIEDQKLVVVTPMTSNMQDISEYHNETASLGRLELKLEFQLGSLSLTLDELSQLSEGITFDLGLSLDAPVSAKVNGQTLARCELVEIDDRLGARVVRLTSNKGEGEKDD